jgi:hypothetical protein
MLIDATDSHVPWELITFSMSDPLAGRIRFARWLCLQPPHGPSLSFKDEALHGQALALTDPAQGFSDLAPMIDDPNNLLDALNVDPPVALVYIGGDSLVHCGQSECKTLRCLWYPSSTELEIGFGLGGIPPVRPIFIASSPHSGWVIRAVNETFGLPHSLLRSAGCAVIGTLGPLDSEQASRITRRFLEAAGSEEGFWPAEALRKLREEAEKEIILSRQPENKERKHALRCSALAKLMFVYYGAPYLRIRTLPMQDNHDG